VKLPMKRLSSVLIQKVRIYSFTQIYFSAMILKNLHSSYIPEIFAVLTSKIQDKSFSVEPMLISDFYK